MVFDFDGTVGLITGGVSGLGLEFAKQFLRSGCKGVTLADVNNEQSQKVLRDIQEEFGINKAIFVNTDVSDIKQFENAFKKTVEHFGNVDILMNNAGILNDAVWEKEIHINVNGTVHGMILGLDNYLQKHKLRDEAVIVNTSSIAGIGKDIGFVPIYCATKSAIIALTRSWGTPFHYNRSKVRVTAICPGATNTPLLFGISGKNLGAPYEELLEKRTGFWPEQTPQHVAQEVVKLIKDSKNGTTWVIEGGEPACEYVFPGRKAFPNDPLL